MMISNHEQLLRLFYSLGCGAMLSLYRDLFRVAHLFHKPSALRLFLEDIVWCVSAAVLFFLISLAISAGDISPAMLAAAVVGFLVCRMTAGRFLMWSARRLQRFFDPLYRRLKSFCAETRDKAANFFKKIEKFLKKGLHRLYTMVYNQKK